MDAEKVLAKVPLFSEMERSDLQRLARVMVKRTYGPGELILKEGDQAVAFYVITSGRVEVVKGLESASPNVLNSLGPGEFFGEMALLEGYLRSASIRAVEDTECLVMSRWDFLAELRGRPNMAVQMLPVLSRRLREAEAQPTE
ncbi:MAG: cyclic nucleotide-binding domain-containing protein [Chloroflexota bacterium]|nr:cyclic nucleotide-binding domain-containing protein [Chloroflexota bacterium]